MEQATSDLLLTAPSPPAAGPMEFTVNKQDLLKELRELQKIVPRAVTMPILVNVLIQATNNALALTATDLELSLRTTCPARVKREGACTIPAHKLYDHVRLLGDGDVTIRLLDNNWVQIKCGRSHTKMASLAPDNYPKLPLFPSDSAITLESPTICSLIAKTVFAISMEDGQYTVNGGLLILNSQGVSMVATDGHRLALAEFTSTNSGMAKETKVVLPKRALAGLSSLLTSSSAERIQFAQDGSTVFFAAGTRLLTSRKIVKSFPNHEPIVRLSSNKQAIVSRQELLSSIQRVAQFSDERSSSIRMRLASNELKVSASCAEAGTSEDIVQATYTGDEIVVGFNSNYLLDFLRATDADKVRWEFKNGDLASEFKPEGSTEQGCNYRYIIMPMRV